MHLSCRRPPDAQLRNRGRANQYAVTLVIKKERPGYWMPRFRGASRSESLSVQRFVQERLELRQMLRHQAGRGRRRRGAPGVTRATVRRVDLVQHPFEIGLHEMPRPHVARLFLAPDHLGALEAAKLLYQRLQRHRIKLLDAHDVDVVDAALLALVIEIVIDLARAQEDAADFRVPPDRGLLIR